MLDVIQLGPFLIKMTTILYIAAGLLGYLTIFFSLKNEAALRKEITEMVSTAVIASLLIWKFSYALFHPQNVWENPAALLYFSGGDAGVWLAVLAAAAYLAFQIRKRQIPVKLFGKTLVLGLVTAWGAGHLLWAVVFRQDWLYDAGQAGISLILFLWLTAGTVQRKRWVAIAGIIGLIGWGMLNTGSSSLVPGQASGNETLKVGLNKGELAPDFELRTLENERIRLSELKGQKVILNLWATWCPPCRAEMPDMQAFYEQEKDQGVTILAVNLFDTEQGEEQVAAFLKDYGITFPVVLDEGKQISRLYRAISIPTSYIIDSQGVIQYKMIGPLTKEMMEKMLASIE
ncbi:cytochrome C biogenesis protein [Brevibacillus panacihumi W25]|uniref:Cytochrome C biogenesis protein n=1 Tax=Brevibacillus panacihumi W25 TaxID=1408254 RepID=V6M7G2_9BACL|nr:redoxin domain-containing protein [Brevibacillus panacihumi]EST54516.1 cytochrome C biogenesis protein [Brevibacillus panacihumi W25]